MRAWNEGLAGLAYGGDYNPEQWPREVWDEDIALMREAGVNLVSLAIFSWATIEPDEGRFAWEWLDDILGRLHDGGIRVALATATASPPPWLATRHPEILPRTVDGLVLSQGGRQHYAVCSPVWRRYAVGMARRMAERYGDHPAVALWHVDNEIGCHVAADYSDAAASAFRAWLRERYGTVDALNEAWGTAFWSQRYGAFDHVLPPRTAPTYPNPTQQLDWMRFSSDANLRYHLELREAVAEVAPDLPATTNFMCGVAFRPLDYFAWGPHVDVVANDHYTRAHDEERHIELAFAADLTRGVASGRPWLLMEHSTSAVNWQPLNRAKEPGEMLRNSLAHVARGADGAMFFQWRQSRAGAEKFHSAMVPHAGTNSLVWRNTVELGRALRALAPVRGSRVAARVAVVLDYENGWAVGLDSHPVNDLDYFAQVLAWYRALWLEGVQVDVVPATGDLDGYDLVVAPHLYLADAPRVAALTGVAERGGVVATTWFSGIVDACDHVVLGGYPGALRALLGVRTEEFCPLQAGQSVGVRCEDGEESRGFRWTERTRLEGAQARATYTDGVLEGLPTITEHEVGRGRAWYVATEPDESLRRTLTRTWLAQAGVRPVVPDAPPGLEAVRREGSEGSFLFLLNHGRAPVDVTVRGQALWGPEPSGGVVTLAPGAVSVVAEQA